MNKTEALVQKIIEGIQEKKGKEIAIVDLQGLEGAICRYFIICQGNSPSHLEAIVGSIAHFADRDLHERPVALDGERNSEWIAMDYVDVVVHAFLPEMRAFYDIENLWADAPLTLIPNLD